MSSALSEVTGDGPAISPLLICEPVTSMRSTSSISAANVLKLWPVNSAVEILSASKCFFLIQNLIAASF